MFEMAGMNFMQVISVLLGQIEMCGGFFPNLISDSKVVV